jgi:hypothetical protein
MRRFRAVLAAILVSVPGAAGAQDHRAGYITYGAGNLSPAEAAQLQQCDTARARNRIAPDAPHNKPCPSSGAQRAQYQNYSRMPLGSALSHR